MTTSFQIVTYPPFMNIFRLNLLTSIKSLNLAPLHDGVLGAGGITTAILDLVTK